MLLVGWCGRGAAACSDCSASSALCACFRSNNPPQQFSLNFIVFWARRWDSQILLPQPALAHCLCEQRNISAATCHLQQQHASCPLQVSGWFNPSFLIALWVRGQLSAGDFFALFAADLAGYFLGGQGAGGGGRAVLGGAAGGGGVVCMYITF